LKLLIEFGLIWFSRLQRKRRKYG